MFVLAIISAIQFAKADDDTKKYSCSSNIDKILKHWNMPTSGFNRKIVCEPLAMDGVTGHYLRVGDPKAKAIKKSFVSNKDGTDAELKETGEKLAAYVKEKDLNRQYQPDGTINENAKPSPKELYGKTVDIGEENLTHSSIITLSGLHPYNAAMSSQIDLIHGNQFTISLNSDCSVYAFGVWSTPADGRKSTLTRISPKDCKLIATTQGPAQTDILAKLGINAGDDLEAKAVELCGSKAFIAQLEKPVVTQTAKKSQNTHKSERNFPQSWGIGWGETGSTHSKHSDGAN